MADTVILTPTATATQSSSFDVDARRMTVYAYSGNGSALAAGEHGTLQRQNPAGTWQDVYDSNGIVQLNGTLPGVDIVGGGRYRIDKAISVQPVGYAIVAGVT